VIMEQRRLGVTEIWSHENKNGTKKYKNKQ